MPNVDNRVDLMVGGNIKAARTTAGLQIVAVAEASGINPKLLMDLESGRKRADARQLVEIARALRINVGDLFRESGASD